MAGFYVGVGRIELSVRHSQGLSAKRKLAGKLKNLLKKEDFSVTEPEVDRTGHLVILGFCGAFSDYSYAKKTMDEMRQKMVGNFGVLDYDYEIFEPASMEEDVDEDEDEDEDPFEPQTYKV